MKNISDLPATAEDVGNLTLEQLVQQVLDVCDPANTVYGHAALQCNTFMSFAALRMAEYIHASKALNRDQDSKFVELLNTGKCHML